MVNPNSSENRLALATYAAGGCIVPELSVLVIGSTERTEFREARAALESMANVRAVPDVAAALMALAEADPVPELLVMVQAYPGQFSQEAVDQLRRAAPLARIVALLGTWCEGETRTGKPCPGVIRVPWHQWPARAWHELTRLGEGACSPWGLPATATEEERQLAIADEPWEPRTGLIAVCSPRADSRHWLSAALRRRGYQVLALRPHDPLPAEPLAALLLDGTECRGEEMEHLRRLRAARGTEPILMLLDFPRVEDRDRALAAGATAVLAKPLVLDDLFRQLVEVPAASPVQTARSESLA